MLPAERHRAIVQLVNTKGSIRVKELSQILAVTEETVRRDLDRLEAEYKIRRSHGGAVRVDEEPGEVSYLQRESENVAEKQAIAREAVRYITPNESIILDASSTAWHVALILPNVPVTVLTNSLKVALELSSRDRVEVISAGGILRAGSLSSVGPVTEGTLGQFHVNRAFLSFKGIHTEYGISESNALQALVKRKMIDIADEVYLLADHSKIQVRDLTRVASLGEIDVLITDKGASQEHLSAIGDFHIQVIQV